MSKSSQLSASAKYLIGGGLLVVSVAAWLFSLRAMDTMSVGIFNFVALWMVMMTAMMLPSVMPAVLLFATVAQSRTQYGFSVAPAFVFVVGCLGVWALTGVMVALVDRVSGGAITMNAWGRVFIGGALVAGGVYQFTRWKMICLGYCHEPIQFFMEHWHDGFPGAIQMGAHHGLYCLGCCWGLTLALIALGLMNPIWMLASALIIFAEKVAPWGKNFARIIGAALILAGVGIAFGWIPPGHTTGAM